MKSTTAFVVVRNQVIVGRDDFAAPGMQWWLGMEPTAGNVTFSLIDTDQEEEVLSAAVPINDGIWHHLVAIYDGTIPAVYLYVDKVKVDEELAPLSYTGDFSATDKDINLGWLDSGTGYYYEGTLDEVALYSRALTSDEIEDHYDNGLAGNGIDYVAPPTTSKKSGGGGGSSGCFIATTAE